MESYAPQGQGFKVKLKSLILNYRRTLRDRRMVHHGRYFVMILLSHAPSIFSGAARNASYR